MAEPNLPSIDGLVPEGDAFRTVIFLDRLSADLANDVDWALRLLAEIGCRFPVVNQENAVRYVEAHRHLNVRRAYERSCRAGAGGQ